MCGVAFFSYIMDTFMSTMEKFKKKVTDVDKTEDLTIWMTLMQTYQVDTPPDQSIMKAIDKEFVYFWAHDRLQAFIEDSPDTHLIPHSIKVEILAENLFADLIERNRAFFRQPFGSDTYFVYDLMNGLQPRDYQQEDPLDRIIAIEDQQVDEMVFVMQGQVGIAFTRLDSYDPD